MVREQGPGVDRPGPLLRQPGHASEEVGAVVIVAEDRGAFDSPHHHVMEGVRPKVPDAVRKRIQTGLAKHGD